MVRLGIVGPGRIVERVMPDMVNAKEIEITAVASRSLPRAEAAARKYGIPHAFGSYEAMATSDLVDLGDIPAPTFAVSMGCNVRCPFVGRPFDEDWGLEDPTEKSDEEFRAVIAQIAQNILQLKEKLRNPSGMLP